VILVNLSRFYNISKIRIISEWGKHSWDAALVLEMKRRKTLLTPENQWDRTVAYFMHLNRSEPFRRGGEGIEEDLCSAAATRIAIGSSVST